MSRPVLWNPIEAITTLQSKLEDNPDMEVIDIIDIIAELETFKTYLSEMLGEF